MMRFARLTCDAGPQRQAERKFAPAPTLLIDRWLGREQKIDPKGAPVAGIVFKKFATFMVQAAWWWLFWCLGLPF